MALELIDESIRRPQDSGYRCIVVIETAGETEIPVGYICFGQTPMTRHTCDLYWIVVDPDRRDKGYGKTLLRAMEESMLAVGGRNIRVETSSKETYTGTIRFYHNEGFTQAGTLPGFYGDGDDLLIFYKQLAPPRTV